MGRCRVGLISWRLCQSQGPASRPVLSRPFPATLVPARPDGSVSVRSRRGGEEVPAVLESRRNGATRRCGREKAGRGIVFIGVVPVFMLRIASCVIGNAHGSAGEDGMKIIDYRRDCPCRSVRAGRLRERGPLCQTVGIRLWPRIVGRGCRLLCYSFPFSFSLGLAGCFTSSHSLSIWFAQVTARPGDARHSSPQLIRTRPRRLRGRGEERQEQQARTWRMWRCRGDGPVSRGETALVLVVVVMVLQPRP